MILYGKPVADALREQCAEWIEVMAWKRTLTVIKDETSDKGYLAAIQREAEQWKVNLMYAEDLKQAAQMPGIRVIDLRRNAARKLHGFYAVDGQSDVGREKAYVGEMYADTPCTAEAIIRMLDYYDIPVAGKHAVVIGRSERVGKPTPMQALAQIAAQDAQEAKDAENLKKARQLMNVLTTIAQMVDFSVTWIELKPKGSPDTYYKDATTKTLEKRC